MNNIWLEGLQVSLVGMLVVFAGLILLIGLISLIKAFGTKEDRQQPAAPLVVATAQAAPAAPVPAPTHDAAVVAAITGALAQVLTEGRSQQLPQGFVVRRIRRV